MVRVALTLTFAALLASALAPPASAGERKVTKTETTMHADITVTGSWIRVVLPNRPSAGYMQIATTAEGGDRLLGAASESFEAVELHRTSMTDGKMVMAPIDSLEIPAGGGAILEPGGAHLMMFGGGALKEGDTVSVTLFFENAGEIDVVFEVRKKAGGGHNH